MADQITSQLQKAHKGKAVHVLELLLLLTVLIIWRTPSPTVTLPSACISNTEPRACLWTGTCSLCPSVRGCILLQTPSPGTNFERKHCGDAIKAICRQPVKPHSIKTSVKKLTSVGKCLSSHTRSNVSYSTFEIMLVWRTIFSSARLPFHSG